MCSKHNQRRQHHVQRGWAGPPGTLAGPVGCSCTLLTPGHIHRCGSTASPAASTGALLNYYPVHSLQEARLQDGSSQAARAW